jgi:hypothetical protein
MVRGSERTLGSGEGCRLASERKRRERGVAALQWIERERG